MRSSARGQGIAMPEDNPVEEGLFMCRLFENNTFFWRRKLVRVLTLFWGVKIALVIFTLPMGTFRVHLF